jgi:hypothetical protein
MSWHLPSSSSYLKKQQSDFQWRFCRFFSKKKFNFLFIHFIFSLFRKKKTFWCPLEKSFAQRAKKVLNFLKVLFALSLTFITKFSPRSQCLQVENFPLTHGRAKISPRSIIFTQKYIFVTFSFAGRVKKVDMRCDCYCIFFSFLARRINSKGKIFSFLLLKVSPWESSYLLLFPFIHHLMATSNEYFFLSYFITAITFNGHFASGKYFCVCLRASGRDEIGLEG